MTSEIGASEGSSGAFVHKHGAKASSAAFAPRALALAAAVAVAFYAVAGLAEAALIRVLQPSEMELDWISDVVLSGALGVSIYLWLHLRATRLAVTEHERAQVIIQSQLSMAEAMQRRLLPAIPPPADGFEWAALLAPAGRIGGDFFDFVEPAPGLRLTLIADISGKGISAAMALALLRFTFRHLARNSTSLADLSTRMSAALHEEWHGSPYVTCVIARVDVARRTLTYVNAGHPPGMLVREGQDYQLTEGGPPLGLFECATYVESQLDLIDGDVCAFMTDGITEAFDNGLGSSRTVVIDAVREEGRSASAVCYAVMERARDAHGPKDIEDWTDDRTIVVVAFNESPHLSNQRRAPARAGSARATS
ncbi:MAG TPA: PP2C family protein-serine/threonine phosphatase [Vicinamibacterales bacterium]|jgi:serine phosphatase RsbU (regulator of sigma subunit)|nr:PP2C family protein-serine/threonine phosphatase [Vicinamibacterales bacterium]